MLKLQAVGSGPKAGRIVGQEKQHAASDFRGFWKRRWLIRQMFQGRDLALTEVEHPRGQRHPVFKVGIWPQLGHGFLVPEIWMAVFREQHPTPVVDVVARPEFNGVRVGIYRGLMLTLGGMNVTDQTPCFVALIVDAKAVLGSSQCMVLQIEAMHRGGCGQPCVNVLCTVCAQAIPQEANGRLRVASIELISRLLDQIGERCIRRGLGRLRGRWLRFH